MIVYSIKMAKTLATVLGLYFVLVTVPTKAFAGDIDVYIAYSQKNKKDRTALKKALPSHLKVKFYNVDLLALADYSGKQKVIAKLERAKIVILVKDLAVKLLDGAAINTDLLVLESFQTSIKSDKLNLHIVTSGADAAFGKSEVTYHAAKKSDLGDSKKLRAAKAILVENMDIYQATAAVVESLLAQ